MLLKMFNRNFTVRKLEQLGSPKSALLTDLVLPRESAYHFLTDNGTVIGPPQTIPYLSELEKVAQVEHVTNFLGSKQIGRPKVVQFNVTRETTQYHRTNKGLRRMRDAKAVERDVRALYILNYAPMRHVYTYPENMLSWYQKWSNIFDTMTRKVDNVAQAYGRNNYIDMDVPDKLPSVAEFKKAANKQTAETLSPFADERLLALLEVWKWLGDSPSTSLFNNIDDRFFNRVNILLTFNERFVNLNLGELLFWKDFGPDHPGVINPYQLQLRFYSSIRKLMTHSMDTAVEPDEDFDADAKEVLGDVKEEAPASEEELEVSAEEFEKEVVELEKADAFEVKRIVPNEEVEVTTENLQVGPDFETGLTEAIDYYAENSIVSTKEYKFFQENAAAFKEIDNPYGEGKLTDLLEIKPEELAIKPDVLFDDPTILDKSLLTTPTRQWDKQYNTEVLPKDIASCIVSTQRAGVMVKDYKVSKLVDASGGSETHTVTIQPIGGNQSTLHFTIPSIDEEGYWRSNDVTYNMRKQRVDLPIRKVGHDTVAITSFYGKNFIRRNENAVNNYPKWLTDNLIRLGLDDVDNTVSDVKFANRFDPSVNLPRDYTTISTRVAGFKSGGITYSFDHAIVEELFEADVVKQLAKDKLVPIGKGKGKVIAMDQESIVYSVQGDKVEDIGKIDELIGLPVEKAPREFTELSMMGKSIPLAICIAYLMGLEKALKLFGVQYRTVEPNVRYSPLRNEMVMKLSDATVICELDTEVRRLLFQGLVPYIKLMRGFSLRDMNQKDVYLNLIQKNGLTNRYLKELELMDQLFVDPITERMLKEMKEPTTFKGLLVRSNEMLTLDSHKEETDLTEQHIFGNQRIAGAIYTEMVRGTRAYRNKPGNNKKIEVLPNQVWMSIAKDPSIMISQDHNPIQLMKERDVLTFGGTGGRSRRSMVKRTRKFTKSDLGVISESNVDSGDVGITTYLTGNPQVASVDGIVKESKETTAASLLSNSALLAPGVLFDDGKRVSFVGNQHGSGIAADGYIVPAYRTGAEKTIAHKTSNKMAVAAELSGKVNEVTDSSITVVYDGTPKTEKTYPLGKHFGHYEGSTFPHLNVTQLKKGAKFNKGSILAYNEKFFEPDIINPEQVNWKAGAMARIALIEGVDEIEDSSAISKDLALRLKTQVTKVKNIAVKFDQAVMDLVGVGDKVRSETILCTIEDQITASSDTFKDESLETIRSLAAQTPKAKANGFIDKIEIFYNGDYEDMSESILSIAKMGDRARRKMAKSSPKAEADNGRVDSTLRIDGNPVELDTLIIRIYMTVEQPAIGGDKAVFGNQMKSTFRRVMEGVNETEAGEPIDARFGRVSVDARIVLSFFRIGTTNKVAELIAQDCLRILEEE